MLKLRWLSPALLAHFAALAWIPGLPEAKLLAEPAAAAKEIYARQIRPFLETHCFDCHAQERAQANLRLDTLADGVTGAATARQWTKVLERLEVGDMPPKRRERPPADQHGQVLQWIGAQLLDWEQRSQSAAGSLALRRLSRRQYENTVHDLLAIDRELKDRLPEDTRALGFDNIGEALQLSAGHLDAYLDAADAALDAAIVHGPPPQKVQWRKVGMEALGMELQQGALNLEDAAVLFGSRTITLVSLIRNGQAPLPEGRYRIRVSVYAYQSQGKPVEIEVTTNRVGDSGGQLIGYFDVPPDTPVIIECTPRLRASEWVTCRVRLPAASNIRDPRQHRSPGLAVHWIEVEGPLGDWPPPSHRILFGDLPLRPLSKGGPTMTVASEQPRADAERLLLTFLARAYRRTVTPDEAKPFLGLVTAQLDAGKSFEAAMRTGYRAVLCSPAFLFLQERHGVGDEFALASRLSYFLWNSTPDEELQSLAARGTLSRPETLRAQTERLLNHPKAQRFIQDFVAQWLELRRIDDTVPDKKLYPEFGSYDNDIALRQAIVKETELFFEELLRRDLSLTNFVDADFSILNERLAKHYGISGVEGSSMRVVKLPPDTHRGGVLTHASVLKLTANGSTTSPVVRGAWVLRNIVGKPTDPPPPNVGAVEPDISGARTIRELLDKHRRLPSCAGCHTKIDSLGFALENFDVMGRWRDEYRVLGGPDLATPRKGPAVEADYRLPDGRDIRNIDDLKQFLLEDKDQLARALAEKLLIYGTGRALRFSDRDRVREVVERIRGRNYGLRSLIHEVVQSRAFTQP
jgi:hypothetical protein